MSTKKFFQVLFDPHEATCFANTPYGTDVSMDPMPGDVFFSINPLRGSRSDANVTCYRNILLECDKMPLEDQIEYVTSKVPVSTIVYSGGKSYHFIISLAEPCSTREEYDILVRRLHKLLPSVDPTTKNPSRFSRLPDVVRPDTARLQALEFVGSRVTRATLEALLPPAEARPLPSKQPEGFFSTLVVDAMFYPEAVMTKIGIESRNGFFFWLGQRLREGGASYEQKLQIIEQTYSSLKNKSDFSLQEAKQAGRL